MAVAIPVAMLIASAISGALKKKSQQTSSGTQTTMPTFDPATSGLRNALLGSITNRLRTGVDQRVLEAQGISHANNVFRNISAGQGADLTSRGLEGSPVAGAVAGNTNAARGSSIVDWLNQVPGIARQQQGQDLGLGGDILGMFKGSTQTFNGTNMQQTGGGAAGAMEGLGGMLGMLYASGAFNKDGNGVSGMSMPSNNYLSGLGYGGTGIPPTNPYGYGPAGPAPGRDSQYG